MPEFTHIQLADADLYYDLWAKTPSHSIDYTLPNLFGWRSYFDLTWALGDKLGWIRQEKKPAYWAPIGAWDAVDWNAEFAAFEKPMTIIRVPEPLLTLWQRDIPSIQIAESRGQWEYLYKRDDLTLLPGRHFHKKKNHVSSYTRAYGEPDYRTLCECIVEDVLKLEDEWCQWHECEHSPSLQAENAAINQVLSHCSNFRHLLGGALYIDGRMAAFSIGEWLDTSTVGVHYEKGLLGYKGIYQTINNAFAKHLDPACTIVNRAQDLDEDGLRSAKMSYNPCDFLKKYTVTIV